MSSQSLLPDNRTPLETALEKSLAKQLQNIESPYPQLWDPAQVKPTLLPYLAHAKGVPDWGEDTEAAKRDTVANIWTVQRQAGTRQAVKQAVDALGFDAEVIYGSQPYLMQVNLWYLRRDTLEPDLFSRTIRRIESVKSERDDLKVTLNAGSYCDLVVELGSCSAINATSVCAIEADTEVTLNINLAAVSQVKASSLPAMGIEQTDLYQGIAVSSHCSTKQTVTECY